MNTLEAITRLANLARTNCGSSDAARSVLAYAWNARWPIRDLYKLDAKNRRAAIILIDRDWAIEDYIIESLVPEISAWAADQGKTED
jgi:hypothetical protein